MTMIERWGQFYLDYLRPLIDIGVLAYIFYKLYLVIQKTRGAQLLKGASLLIALYALAKVCRLSTLSWLINTIAPGFVIGIALIFQPELRKIFMKLSQSRIFHYSIKTNRTNIESVLDAAEELSRGGVSNKPHGMLVVFQRQSSLRDFQETGQILNADLTTNLLLTIFMFETTMHDGAVIVQDNKILAAGCFLPLSENYEIKKTYGTRHRAALGTAESTDAVVLIVSEETGAISLAYDSKLYYNLSREEILSTLKRELHIKSESADIADISDKKDEDNEPKSVDRKNIE